MRFHRTYHETDPAKVDALGDTLVVAPAFGSYLHIGPDKGPVGYHLYRSAKPAYDEKPVASYALVDGVMTCTEVAVAAPVKGKKS